MKIHPDAHGRSKIAGHLLAGGLTLSMGYAFGLFSLGACGGSQAGVAPPMDGTLPERVVEKLRDCASRSPAPLEPVKHTVSYDVFMDPDGRVDNVALRSSTFHADEVEACIENALYDVSPRTTVASLRRREPAEPPSVPTEARTLLGHPGLLVLGAGSAQVGLAIGAMAVAVVVYFYVVHKSSTHRPPPPAQVEDPPKPEPPRPEPRTQSDPKTTDPPPPAPKPPKPRPGCSDAFPKIVNCAYIQQKKYPDRKSALEAVIKSLPREWQKRPFTSKGTQSSDNLGGADHTTYWSADGKTKISIGCYKQCCKNTDDGPIIEEGMNCYELNHARFEAR
jgi:hypothetical protein